MGKKKVEKRGIVTLVFKKEKIKSGDWLTFDRMLDLGCQVNLVKPSEPVGKYRLFSVVERKGFRHKLKALDRRSRLSGALKGMRFLYLKFKENGK